MKKLIIYLVAVLFVLCGSSALWGSTLDNRLVVVSNTLSPIDVTFSIDNISFPDTGYVFGQVIGGEFEAFDNQASVDLTSNTIVDFAISKLSLTSNPSEYYSLSEGEGTVSFYQSTYHNDTPATPSWVSEWWGSVSILWNTPDNLNLDLLSTNEGGGLAPVPIPATALLFCSSILGIVGIRRKMVK